MKRFLLFMSMAVAASAASATDIDYTSGIFIINEDWYGHQNSTVNYLMPDNNDGDFWHYRVIQAENPGYELGCTNQYGTIWNGRFYLIAKQEKDPGASITGGRITVADASTMKILHQSTVIDPSGAQCDGRGFVGVDAHKGYISSSNGVWILDLDTYEIKGQVQGTSNPNVGGGNDKPNTDPTGSLYHGQCGTMIRAAGRIFVAHQSAGLLVVDPATDCVTQTIPMDFIAEGAGIGSIIKSADGMLWISVAKDCQGTGTPLPYLVNVDPSTLSINTIDIPSSMLPPANSWYAWTPDAFCASAITNTIYWKGSSSRWFAGTRIYKMDIATGNITEHINLDNEGADWKVYGCSMGIHPVTDELYVSLYHEFGTPVYITRRYAPSGVKIRDYDMISNYWFPSMFVFPEANEHANIHNVTNDSNSDITEFYNLNGIRIESERLTPGIYIKRSGMRTQKVLIR